MRIATLPTGDPVHRYEKCIVVAFGGKRRVLSTCPFHGGYREDLTAVFNNDINQGPGMECRMLSEDYEEHIKLMAKKLGLDPDTSTGMATAASMENVSIQTEQSGNTIVTAVVTGGIENNAGRAGDPASWDEAEEKQSPVRAGTINIMLFFNVDLTEGALPRALVTCTEAKTAAIQELLAPSRYSMGLATGSGTDGTIVVCNAEAELRLTNAGKHSRLGELIGKAVKRAVKEALKLQTGLSPESQHHVLKRVDRFGITETDLWENCRNRELSRADFSDRLYRIGQRGDLTASVSLYVHLMDQLAWGLLAPEEAWTSGRKVLNMMTDMEDINMEREAEPAKTADAADSAVMLNDMIGALKETLCRIVCCQYRMKKGMKKNDKTDEYDRLPPG